MNEDKKTERRREIIAVCLDCFVEKGLTITTTKDLCTAAKLQNGGIYYYFSTKEEIVLACAEAAIERIEKGAFGIVFEDIRENSTAHKTGHHFFLLLGHRKYLSGTSEAP